MMSGFVAGVQAEISQTMEVVAVPKIEGTIELGDVFGVMVLILIVMWDEV
jgi:hypothetical protein